MSTTANGSDVLSGKTVAELNMLIEQATAQKAVLFDTELMRLVEEIEERCRVLGVSTGQLFTLLRKGKRGRPRKPTP